MSILKRMRESIELMEVVLGLEVHLVEVIHLMEHMETGKFHWI